MSQTNDGTFIFSKAINIVAASHHSLHEAPMLKLYFSPGACSLVPHIVLRESGTPFTLVKVDLATHRLRDGGDYYRINPKGQVPLLELDDGSRLSEGPVIAQYVADHAGSTSLMPPAGTIERYRVMEWQNYVTAELHKSFHPLFSADFDAAAKRAYAALLRKKFEWVDTQLEGREYLTGSTFTGADAYLFVVTLWSKHVGLDLTDLSHLQAFAQRVAARPAVREAMKAEGLPV
jgi:glutathione S-transferase